MGLVTPDIVVGLYRDGVTASAPSVAMRIVCGEQMPVGLVETLVEFVPEG